VGVIIEASLTRPKLDMQLSFTEKIKKKIDFTLKAKQNLHREIILYHQIHVVETRSYGFIYPPTRITHVALSTPSGSRSVLAMRGNDGGRG
jgi:hypothetical protein